VYSVRDWQFFSTTSLRVLFGLLLYLGPFALYSIHFFTQSSSSSFHNKCRYCRNLFSCNTSVVSSIPNLSLSSLVGQIKIYRHLSIAGPWNLVPGSNLGSIQITTKQWLSTSNNMHFRQHWVLNVGLSMVSQKLTGFCCFLLDTVLSNCHTRSRTTQNTYSEIGQCMHAQYKHCGLDMTDKETVHWCFEVFWASNIWSRSGHY